MTDLDEKKISRIDRGAAKAAIKAQDGAKLESLLATNETLDLSACGLDKSDAAFLAKHLPDPNCKVTNLALSGNNVGPEGANSIAEALKNPNCKVTDLNLQRNNIGPKGAKSIAEALKNPNCKVTNLNLHLTNIGSDGAKSIAEALKDPNCKVTSLNLWSNNIGSEGAKSIAEALKNPNCKVTNLNLSENGIGPEDAKSIAEAMKNPNCNVTVLNLLINKIGPDGAKSIAAALKDPNCKVTNLNLSDNHINPESAKSIAEALKDPNCKLTNLELWHNNIGPKGAKNITEALKDPNCKVTDLNLGYNHIDPDGAKSIAEALRDPNCKVTDLNLFGNNIGPMGAESVADALKDPNCKVTNLSLRNNQIGDEGAKSIAEALKNPNCKVTNLNLSNNKIGPEGAKSIAEAVKNPNCKVTNLNLSKNNIGPEGAKSIAEALKVNPCLQELHWDSEYRLGKLLVASLPAQFSQSDDRAVLEHLRRVRPGPTTAPTNQNPPRPPPRPLPSPLSPSPKTSLTAAVAAPLTPLIDPQQQVIDLLLEKFKDISHEELFHRFEANARDMSKDVDVEAVQQRLSSLEAQFSPLNAQQEKEQAKLHKLQAILQSNNLRDYFVYFKTLLTSSYIATAAIASDKVVQAKSGLAKIGELLGKAMSAVPVVGVAGPLFTAVLEKVGERNQRKAVGSILSILSGNNEADAITEALAMKMTNVRYEMLLMLSAERTETFKNKLKSWCTGKAVLNASEQKAANDAESVLLILASGKVVHKRTKASLHEHGEEVADLILKELQIENVPNMLVVSMVQGPVSHDAAAKATSGASPVSISTSPVSSSSSSVSVEELRLQHEQQRTDIAALAKQVETLRTTTTDANKVRHVEEQLKKLSHKMSQLESEFGLSDGGDQIQLQQSKSSNARARARPAFAIADVTELREKVHALGISFVELKEHVSSTNDGNEQSRDVANLIAEQTCAKLNKGMKKKDEQKMKEIITKECLFKLSHLDLGHEDITALSCILMDVLRSFIGKDNIEWKRENELKGAVQAALNTFVQSTMLIRPQLRGLQ